MKANNDGFETAGFPLG